MPKLIILQGLPGTGKTTWRNEYMRKHENDTVVVCRDEIRHELSDYSHSGDIEKKVTNIEISRVRNALGDGFDVIVDATNMHPKTVALWKYIGKHKDVELEFMPMPYIPMSEAIRRDANADRDHHCGREVIERFYRNYYPDKYYAEKNESNKKHKIFIHHDRIPVNESLPKAVICDIDGTLSWMDRNPFDYARVDEDRLDERMLQILKAMDIAGVSIIIMSGREGTEICVEKTRKWLDSVLGDIEYQLFLKPAKDYRPDNVVKKELFENNIRGKYDVICVYEDRDKVVKMWRDMGLLCCQVAECEEMNKNNNKQ